MRYMKVLAVLLAAGALVVAGCGDDDNNSGGSTSKAAGNGTDRAFVADMTIHHESAIEMAKIAQDRGQSTFVKELADDIVKTQAKEIKIFASEDEGLDTAGITVGSLGVAEHMKGMEGEPATLKSADPFDAAFLKMMIPHHEGAIEMAKAELAKGQNRELKATASDIIGVQQREITAMRKHLGGDDKTSEEDPEHGTGHSG